MHSIRCERVDILGKAPWKNEFVRPAAPTPALTRFDAWLADSVDAATRAPGWADAYAAGAMHAFVFRSAEGGAPSTDRVELLAGALTPSQDGAGRQYPIALVGTLVVPALLAGAPELLPLVIEDFWQAAIDLLLSAKSKPVDTNDESFRQLQASFGFPLEEAHAGYAQWTNNVSVGQLWSLLFGAQAPRTPEQTIDDLIAAAAPFRGTEQPRTPLTLRLPLGSAAGAAVCLWVDLLRRTARWRATIPSFFWSHDGSTGTMLLHLGGPPRSTLAELWGPRRARDEVFDLTAPRADVAPPVNAGVRPVLTQSLAEVLASVSSI
jgi:type VI secretion system ImpM family protein